MGNISQCPPGGPGGEVSLLPVEGTTDAEAITSFQRAYPGAQNNALCTDGTSYYVRLDRLNTSNAPSEGSANTKEELIWLIQRKQDAIVSFLSQVSQDRLDLSTALKVKSQLDEQEKSSSTFGRIMTGLGAYVGGVGFAWGAFGVGVPGLTDWMANREFQKTLSDRNLCVNPEMLRQPQTAGSFFKKPFFLAHAAAAAGYGGYQLYNGLSADSSGVPEIEKSPVALDNVKHYSQGQLEKMSLSELQEVSRKLNVAVSQIGRVRRELANQRIPLQNEMTRANLDAMAGNKSFLDRLMPHMPELVFGGTAGTIVGFGPFNHKWQGFYNSTSLHQRAALSEGALDQLVQSGALVSCEGKKSEAPQDAAATSTVATSAFTEAEYRSLAETTGAPAEFVEDVFAHPGNHTVPSELIPFFAPYRHEALESKDLQKMGDLASKAPDLLADRYGRTPEEKAQIQGAVGRLIAANKQATYTYGTDVNLLKWSMQWCVSRLESGFIPSPREVDHVIALTATGRAENGVIATYFKIQRAAVEKNVSFEEARQAHWKAMNEIAAHDRLLEQLKSQGYRPASYRDFQKRLGDLLFPNQKEALRAQFDVDYEGDDVHTQDGQQVFVKGDEWFVFEGSTSKAVESAGAGAVAVMPMPIPVPLSMPAPVGFGQPAFAF